MTHHPTWLITGASSGLGMAFAKHAIAAGYNVVATARTLSKLDSLAKAAPERVLTLPLDVTAKGEVDVTIMEAIARFGRIDVLINNAGYGIVGAVEETSDLELRAQLETNFFGAAACIKAVLPIMRQQQSGAIVNISSLGGQLSFAGFGAYSASKFALEGLSEALAQEVAPFGIKVLIVEPGAFRTGFAAEALKHMPAIEAYTDTVGSTRDFARGMHGTQEGNPDKVPHAVEKALAANPTPLRLQLGKDAVDAVKEHSEKILADLTKWKTIALDVRF